MTNDVYEAIRKPNHSRPAGTQRENRDTIRISNRRPGGCITAAESAACRTEGRGRFSFLGYLVIHSFLGLGALRAVAGDPVAQQNFQLHPGWNAIWLEVRQPANSSDSIFATCPWLACGRAPRGCRPLSFIQDRRNRRSMRPAGSVGSIRLDPRRSLATCSRCMSEPRVSDSS